MKVIYLSPKEVARPCSKTFDSVRGEIRLNCRLLTISFNKWFISNLVKKNLYIFLNVPFATRLYNLFLKYN